MAAVSLFWDTNMVAVTSCENILLGTLKELERRRRRQRQKAISLVSKRTTLHVHHAFLNIFSFFFFAVSAQLGRK